MITTDNPLTINEVETLREVFNCFFFTDYEVKVKGKSVIFEEV